MRSVYQRGAINGLTVGVAVSLLLGALSGWRAVSTFLVIVSLACLAVMLKDIREIRRSRRELQRISRKLAWYERNGRWPTEL